MNFERSPVDNQNIPAKIQTLRKQAAQKKRDGYQTSYAERMIDLADFYYNNNNLDESIGYVMKATKALEAAPLTKKEILSGNISFPEPDLGMKNKEKVEENAAGAKKEMQKTKERESFNEVPIQDKPPRIEPYRIEGICPGCQKEVEP
ncbi:MAG: hypothetical protein QW728_03565, partial [Thermoplasmata archaeon]